MKIDAPVPEVKGFLRWQARRRACRRKMQRPELRSGICSRTGAELSTNSVDGVGVSLSGGPLHLHAEGL